MARPLRLHALMRAPVVAAVDESPMTREPADSDAVTGSIACLASLPSTVSR
jgi:hypothetical protein